MPSLVTVSYTHLGAEYEGLPMYCFSQKSTKHAISRSSYKEIQMGDIVQLNLSAKINGYSPSIGMPISMGKLSPIKRELVEFGLQAHMWTEKQLKAGRIAGDIAKDFIKFFEANGHRENYFYGPCHGLGPVSYTHLDVYKRQVFLYFYRISAI